jgi:hypothetical protein
VPMMSAAEADCRAATRERAAMNREEFFIIIFDLSSAKAGENYHPQKRAASD